MIPIFPQASFHCSQTCRWSFGTWSPKVIATTNCCPWIAVGTTTLLGYDNCKKGNCWFCTAHSNSPLSPVNIRLQIIIVFDQFTRQGYVLYTYTLYGIYIYMLNIVLTITKTITIIVTPTHNTNNFNYIII